MRDNLSQTRSCAIHDHTLHTGQVKRVKADVASSCGMTTLFQASSRCPAIRCQITKKGRCVRRLSRHKWSRSEVGLFRAFVIFYISVKSQARFIMWGYNATPHVQDELWQIYCVLGLRIELSSKFSVPPCVIWTCVIALCFMTLNNREEFYNSNSVDYHSN